MNSDPPPTTLLDREPPGAPPTTWPRSCGRHLRRRPARPPNCCGPISGHTGNAGDLLPVEAYLAATQNPVPEDVVIDLAYGEWLLLQKGNEPGAAEDYARRFPRITAPVFDGSGLWKSP